MTDSFFYYKNDELIKHYEDDSIMSIYRKYRTYSKDQIILKEIPLYNASRLSSHMRKISMNQFIGNMRCSPLISLRSISFLIGMLSGRS